MENSDILELKIVLSNTKPKVHRTIQIEASRTFYELHVAIQIAFGWENSHLHMFEIGDDRIGMSEFDEFEDEHTIEESAIRLYETGLKLEDKFEYIYDFGDHWAHEVEIVKIVEPKNTYYPKCVRGARNRPPEDCGGIDSFEDFKEIMGNRKHPEFKEMKIWYGGMFDEDLFEKDQINEDFKNFDSIVEEMSLYEED